MYAKQCGVKDTAKCLKTVNDFIENNIQTPYVNAEVEKPPKPKGCSRDYQSRDISAKSDDSELDDFESDDDPVRPTPPLPFGKQPTHSSASKGVILPEPEEQSDEGQSRGGSTFFPKLNSIEKVQVEHNGIIQKLRAKALNMKDLTIDLAKFWDIKKIDILGAIMQIESVRKSLKEENIDPYFEYDPSKRYPIIDPLQRLLGKLNSIWLHIHRQAQSTGIAEIFKWIFDDTPSVVDLKVFHPEFSSIGPRLKYQIKKAVDQHKIDELIEYCKLRNNFRDVNLLFGHWEELAFGLLYTEDLKIRKRMIEIRHKMEAIRSDVGLYLEEQKNDTANQKHQTDSINGHQKLRQLFHSEAEELQSIGEGPDAIKYRTLIKRVNWDLSYLPERDMLPQVKRFAEEPLLQGPVELNKWYCELIKPNKKYKDIHKSVRQYFTDPARVEQLAQYPEGQSQNPATLIIINGCIQFFNSLELMVAANELFKMMMNLRGNNEDVFEFIRDKCDVTYNEKSICVVL